MLVAVVAIAMVLGLAGTLVPGIPGLFLIWGAALAYGLINGFTAGGAVFFIIITVLSVLGFAARYVIAPRKARGAGAARQSILIAIACAAVGLFVIPVIGMPIGGVLGLYAGERFRGISHDTAWSATVATLVGIGFGIIVEVAFALFAIFTWIGWVVFA